MWLTPSVEDAGRQGKAENWRQYEEGGRTTQARLRNQVMWPTPQAEDSHHGGRSMSPRGVQKRLTEGRQLDLGQTVALRGGPLTRQTYPTPKGSPSGPDYARTNRPESGGDDLATAIARKTYPTPRASDGPPRSSHNRTWSTTDKNLHTVVAKPEGGQLNPEWVDWLMGWPIGWESLDPLLKERMNEWFALNAGQGVRILREEVQPLPLPGTHRGQGGVYEAEVLLPPVCESKKTGGAAGLAVEGEEIPQQSVRGMRDQDTASSSPCGRRHHEPLPGESSDPVRLVPSLPSSHGSEAWSSCPWKTCIPRVAVGVKHRVDRLRALGNGQVPAVAAAAWRMLIAAPLTKLKQSPSLYVRSLVESGAGGRNASGKS